MNLGISRGAQSKWLSVRINFYLIFLWLSLHIHIVFSLLTRTAIIVACLVAFRALFTSSAKSQRLHHHQNNYQTDPERKPFKDLGFQNIDQSSISISAKNVIHEPPSAFFPFARKFSIDKRSHPEGVRNSVAEQHYSLSTNGSRRGILAVDDDQIRVHTEFSVYPETPNQEGNK